MWRERGEKGRFSPQRRHCLSRLGSGTPASWGGVPSRSVMATGVGRPRLVRGLGILPEMLISIPVMDSHGPPCFCLVGRDKRLVLRELVCGGGLSLDGNGQQ